MCKIRNMAKRTEAQLTKSAQKLIEEIKDESDLTNKLILSAGVIAFAEASPEQRIQWIAKAQAGLYDFTFSNEALVRSMLSQMIDEIPADLKTKKAGQKASS